MEPTSWRSLCDTKQKKSLSWTHEHLATMTSCVRVGVTPTWEAKLRTCRRAVRQAKELPKEEKREPLEAAGRHQCWDQNDDSSCSVDKGSAPSRRHAGRCNGKSKSENEYCLQTC